MHKTASPNGPFLRYFQTVAGRKLVFLGAGTLTLGLFAINYIPHTFGVDYYKKFVQCYQNGIERPIPDALRKRIETAMDNLAISEYDRKFIKPFIVFGLDLFNAGSTNFISGAMLGIPVNYTYDDPNDVRYNEIRFLNKSIDWESECGKLLKEAIFLTEDEQIFGLSKEILQLQTHRVLLNSFFPSVSFLMVYAIGRYFNASMNLYARHFSIRLVLYSILGLFGLGTWSFLKDFNQVSYDTDFDKHLSSLGPEYVEAGVRYYDKLLKKNMALRALLGNDTYTAKGNNNYLVRQKTLPLTVSKSFFELKLKEQNESAQNTTEMTQ